MPFATINSRDKHFLKHGHKFGAVDAAHYEGMADAFMFGPMNADTHECHRRNGDIVRLDFVTTYFGVGMRPTIVLTFYPAGPFRVSAQDYFNYECRRTNI